MDVKYEKRNGELKIYLYGEIDEYYAKKTKNFLKSGEKLLTFFSNYYSILQRRECTGCSAVGSARGLGPWGREFESLHPDQFKLCLIIHYDVQGPLAQQVRAVGS